MCRKSKGQGQVWQRTARPRNEEILQRVLPTKIGGSLRQRKDGVSHYEKLYIGRAESAHTVAAGRRAICGGGLYSTARVEGDQAMVSEHETSENIAAPSAEKEARRRSGGNCQLTAAKMWIGTRSPRRSSCWKQTCGRKHMRRICKRYKARGSTTSTPLIRRQEKGGRWWAAGGVTAVMNVGKAFRCRAHSGCMAGRQHAAVE